ncbi:probable glutamate receptor [Panulirus ornatus]|uniref:probable glutamate receptor n=1 Tax=Panulirus ornatus TaxID=150431 RepID=UPI003A89BE42
MLVPAFDPRCTILLLTDGSTSYDHIKGIGQVRGLLGMAVFEVAAADGQEPNVTQAQLDQVISQAQRLRQLSWCVTVVVVSDDPAFLAAFADFSLNGRLLLWPTRLLVVTRLPLSELQDLHETISMTNAMLLIADDTSLSPRYIVYLYLPYTTYDISPLRVASWTPHRGLRLTSHLPLFPDKFSKFLRRPSLVVTAQRSVLTRPVIRQDPDDPSRQQLWFTGHVPNMLEEFAGSVNFSYIYVLSPDGTWGIKQADGSWSGMVGVVSRKEADIGLGPFGVSASRAEVVDFLWPVMITNSRILGGRGMPKVNPWGFLLPLAPLVWVAILTTLLVVPAIALLMSSRLSLKMATGQERWTVDAFQLIRVLLQQDISETGDCWWWEWLVLGVWMMMTLVLTRSYAGNLMSLLAVRYIQQPYQSLRDVLDDPSVTMIWQTNSTSSGYFRYAESGILWEVGEAEKKGRIFYERVVDHARSLDTLVRKGDHVLIEEEMMLTILTSQHFSRTGRCDFYMSREGFLTWMITLIVQKDSPLVSTLSDRIMRITEAGLFLKWMKDITPNSTSCLYQPTKITITTTFSASNVSGMFVALGAGLLSGLLVFVLEIFSAQVLHFEISSHGTRMIS